MRPSIRPLTKAARVGACLALLNFAVPGGAIVAFGVPLKAGVEKGLAARAKAAKELAARRRRSASRLLTEKEAATMQGRSGENPYLAGQAKWDVVYKGVDLMTGNYSTSATDLSFDGGYGIPVNVTRSYSANDGDEGPFGKGWTLSADVRSTAGGLLKSGGAPVRSIPVGFKERPAAEADPNAETATGAAAQPVEAVVATDAGGTQETVQRDVDGVLTTPPWDTNVNENTTYEFVAGGDGNSYQVMLHNETVTTEGTRYVYDKKGSYLNGGTRPWNDPGATPQPANVMKVVSATDRQGNVTTYSYGSGAFDYAKSNGTTRENPLLNVSMPGGHHLQFTWGTTGNATGRVTSVSDDSRTVTYGYAPGGLLASVTTPGGKTTQYGYGTAEVGDFPNAPEAAASILRTIRDPQDGVITICSAMGRYGPPYPGGQSPSCVMTYKILACNQVATYYTYWEDTLQAYGSVEADYGPWLGERHFNYVNDVSNNGQGEIITDFAVNKYIDPQSRTASVRYEYVDDHGLMLHQRSSSLLLTYDLSSQALLTRLAQSDPGYGDPTNGGLPHGLLQESTYNFLGNSLEQKDYRYDTSTGQTSLVSSKSTAYWGTDKYFQQKAVQDQAGRLSFTDYYPRTAPAGKRGQTSRVYDPKYGGLVTSADPAYPVPAYSPPVPSDKVWRYRVRPSDPNAYSARFDYDAQGRPTDVWKLQSAATSPWTYVQTHTTYGGDGAPGWGQASQVEEDYGGIDRTTRTNAYTSWGKASDVTDAAGHRFVTDFDPDGLVQSVTRMDVNPAQTVVSYAYGSSGVENGQPTQVTDGLSGVAQTIAYTQSGGGVGLPSSVTETNGGDAYSVGYTYDAAGDREIATYATPSGTVRWAYRDYATLGANPSAPSRVFTKLVRLDAQGQATPEEIQYDYDGSGRLFEAAFGQTPGSSSRLSNGGYYDQSHPAASRARAQYRYDDLGHLTLVAHYWDTLVNNQYQTKAILANQCDYEVSTGLNRGLKTASRFYSQSASDPTQFALQRTETYGYDPQLDRLTGADYGDGNPNQSQSWSYDAAGNRGDATVDSLNRPTYLASIGSGQPVTSDVLGNRLTTQGQPNAYVSSIRRYDWDCLNRLSSVHDEFYGVETTINLIGAYVYRADGMRVAQTTRKLQTEYRYDGQMAIEDVEDGVYGYASSLGHVVTRYGLGARGVDLIERTDKQGNVVTGFPIYDAHGNNVATLSRDGNGGYSLGDRRSYDAWGVVRSQQSGGDPKLRYCGSLGHKQDDYSGLVYMRARYYEPLTGRFVSEDHGKHDGLNWFAYAKNDPVNNVDETGNETLQQAYLLALVQSFFSTVLNYGAQAALGVTLTPEKLAGIAATFLITGVLSPLASMPNGEAISPAQMLEKMKVRGSVGAFVGLSSGVALAVIHGMYAGKLEAELFYIDNCT